MGAEPDQAVGAEQQIAVVVELADPRAGGFIFGEVEGDDVFSGDACRGDGFVADGVDDIVEPGTGDDDDDERAVVGDGEVEAEALAQRLGGQGAGLRVHRVNR
ncbi:MAG: hypothetical protein R3F65_05195 [bacterium]